jgi:hypothetical protein
MNERESSEPVSWWTVALVGLPLHVLFLVLLSTVALSLFGRYSIAETAAYVGVGILALLVGGRAGRVHGFDWVLAAFIVIGPVYVAIAGFVLLIISQMGV